MANLCLWQVFNRVKYMVYMLYHDITHVSTMITFSVTAMLVARVLMMALMFW